jgi:hypothetical protein
VGGQQYPSDYLSLSTHPSRVSMAHTPYGMHGSTIPTSTCLHGDCAMGCFPFLLTDALEVPVYACLSSAPESSWLVIYSTIPSYYCVDHAPGCGLDVTASVYLLASPFIFWVPSALDDCCRFLGLTISWPYTLS